MAFFIAIQFTYSQTADYKFGIGINFIKNEYNGDYGNGIFDFSKTMYASGGLSFAYYLNPSFNIGVQGSYGTYGFYADPANNFTGKKLEMSLFGQYKLNNGYILSKDSKFAPFISLGVGYASYGQNGTITHDPTIITDGGDLIVPVGLGIKYHVTSRFAIQYQYLYNFTNSDVHDQNRSGGVINTVFGTPAHPFNKPGNDAYGEHLFSLVFNFGKHNDTDHDGVSDKYDKCPDTPVGVKVDARGCPIDSDGDGVADYLDKCPNTPTGVKVDANGCPFDTNTNENEIKDRLKALEDDNRILNDKINKLYEDTLNDSSNNQGIIGNSSFQNIEFEFGSDKLTKSSYSTLDQIAVTLNNNKATVRLSVAGYTDYIGTVDYNQKLSVRRANSVKIYLMNKNVPAKSIFIIGYGEENPIATNETSEGRQKNRRVEFQITK